MFQTNVWSYWKNLFYAFWKTFVKVAHFIPAKMEHILYIIQPNKCIGRKSSIEYHARFLHLTSMKFLCAGTLYIVYAEKPKILENLKVDFKSECVTTSNKVIIEILKLIGRCYQQVSSKTVLILDFYDRRKSYTFYIDCFVVYVFLHYI